MIYLTLVICIFLKQFSTLLYIIAMVKLGWMIAVVMHLYTILCALSEKFAVSTKAGS